MPTLNIDYAAIIKKADDRREILQRLEQRLKEAPERTDRLLQAHLYFKDLEALRQQLDPEGITLLGDLSSAIYSMAYYLGICIANMQNVPQREGARAPLAVMKEV